MSENIDGCASNCENCGRDCESRQGGQSAAAKPHPLSSVKKVIGIVSGKGGVGKSLITALSAVTMQRKGFSCAILDADITGPSIPKMFGIREKAFATEHGILPVKSKTGIQIMSVNLLLPNETDPVIWRGPAVSGAVTQFWTDVIWHDVDFLFADMPPGTSDVALTAFGTLPLDGIIVVFTPQTLVSMVVEKALKMAEMMNIPVLGTVCNMSSFICDGCGKQHRIFGEIPDAARLGFPLLADIPIQPKLAAACDDGLIELYEGDWLNNTAEVLENMISDK